MAKVVSRAEWGARAPRSRQTTTTWAARTEFIVHYSAGPPTQSPRQIQDFHMDAQGWVDVGYNFLVDQAGTVYEGRGWLIVGSHAPGHNTSGIGVCFIGRDGDDTPAARAAIRWLYDEACRRAGRKLKILGHRDVYATSCPGDRLHAWVKAGMPVDGAVQSVTGSSKTGGDPLIGLRKGDKGEAVKALQQLIVYAGRGAALGKAGVDGVYGDATAEALRLVRQDMGSAAKPGYGDEVTGYAYAQLMAAVARKQGGK